MAPPQTTHSNNVDIISLWHGIRRSMRTLLILTIVAGVGTFGVLSSLAPRYTSQAQLAISAKVTNPFPDGNDGQKVPDGRTRRLDREAINTHVNALMAPALLIEVANDLELAKRSEFASTQDGVLAQLMQQVGLSRGPARPASEETVIKVVRERLQVVAARDNRFISIRFSASDPRLAVAFVNQLAESYRQNLVDVPVDETHQAVDALTPKIEQLKKQLLVAEADIERLRAQTDQLRAGAQSTPADVRRMAALKDELIKAETARSAAQSKWQTAKQLSVNGNVEVLHEVQNSPVIQRLLKQRVRVERQVAEARKSMLPKHPRMRRLNSNLERVRSSIRQQVLDVVRGLEKDFRTADFRVQDIRREIDSLKVKVVDTSQNEAQLKSLQSSAKSKRTELERLQRQLQDNKTRVVTKTVPIEAQVVSRARLSDGPTSPQKGSFALIAMAAVFILGLALITAKEIVVARRDRGPRSAGQGVGARREPLLDDAEQAVKISAERVAAAAPTLANIPGPARTSMPRGADNGGTIKQIAGRLLRNGQSVVGYRTIVVGDSQHTDAAPEAVAIAGEIARVGQQVVIVDWNVAGETFGQNDDIQVAGGVLDLLEGTASFEDIIAIIPRSRVHYIGAGNRLEFEDQVLDGDGLNAVLDALDEAYDHVVVVGRFGAAQSLFEAIQGRFDAGISVFEAGHGAPVDDGARQIFLGFEVTDIDLMSYERANGPPTDRVGPARGVSLKTA